MDSFTGRHKKEVCYDGQSHLLLIRNETGPPDLQVFNILVMIMGIKVKTNFSTFRALRCILVPSYAMAKFSSTKKLVKARCPLLRAVCWCNVAHEFFSFLYSLHSGWMQ